jgi:Tol biopolymer transport system component
VAVALEKEPARPELFPPIAAAAPAPEIGDETDVLLLQEAEGLAAVTASIEDQGEGLRAVQPAAEPVVSGSQSQSAMLPRLSADGAWILYLEIPNTGSGQTRLMRMPSNGGVSQMLLELTKYWQHFDCARAPASLCGITEESQDQKKYTIAAFDPAKGRGKVLRTIEKDPSVYDAAGVLSPDGTTFAFSQRGEAEIHVRLLSLSGGSDREITVKGWPNINGLGWAPDGKAFCVGSVSPHARTLLHVDLQGNARVLWQFKGSQAAFWGLPSPDGRYLAIRNSTRESNVWMLEGF